MKHYVWMSVWMVGLGLALVGTGTAATIEQAAASLQADIVRDTKALQDLRAAIEAERMPLAQRLAALQQDVALLREETERVRRLQKQNAQEQQALLEAAATSDASLAFLETLLTEYVRSAETRAGAGAVPALVAQLEPVPTSLQNRDAIAALATTGAAVLHVAERWNRARLGGQAYAGAALDQDGRVQDGTWLAWGPLAWFLPDNPAGDAGIAVTRFGSLEPGVARTDVSMQAPLRTIASGGSAALPVDVTGGDALKVAEGRTGLVDRLQKGGFVMLPLLLTGLVAFLIAVWKAISLYRIRKAVSVDTRPVFEQLRAGHVDEARARADALPMPLRSLVEAAIVHRAAHREHLEEILHEHVLGILPRLERNLGALGVLGGVAPLLGLLGTVTGMIHTFQLVTIFGSGDARLLSGGISEALVTTETGLVIAVPVLLVHAFLMRRAREIVAVLERVLAEMVNRLQLGGDTG